MISNKNPKMKEGVNIQVCTQLPSILFVETIEIGTEEILKIVSLHRELLTDAMEGKFGRCRVRSN